MRVTVIRTMTIREDLWDTSTRIIFIYSFRMTTSNWGEIEIYSEPIDKMMLIETMEVGEAYNLDIEADDIDVQDTVTIVWEIK